MTSPTALCQRFSKLALEGEVELVLKVPWGKLTALCWGNPLDPPVLLCHGRLDACSSFRPLVKHLPRDRFYVSVDLPGNGRSDHYPRGGVVTVTDYLPPIEKIRDHFKWKKFTYIGHSLGSVIGKYFNHIYPGQITHMVDVDPEPAYTAVIPDLTVWYKYYYNIFYGDETYKKLNSGPESAPRYTYEDVRARMMKARGLNEDNVDHVLERCLEPAGDGLYRITYDQRLKYVQYHTFLYGSLQEFYTAPKTPTFAIFATKSIARGIYESTPFAMNDSLWKNGNYRHVVMEGGHDLHLQKPEELSRHIIQFFKDNPLNVEL